uniref:Uncharacterized protein n=5 Tax=Triticinae TaxID=1648030 RepID=A0A452YNT7_AEGTS
MELATRWVREQSTLPPFFCSSGGASMLVVELGIWVIPLTLVFVPCRRIVLLLSRLQELRRTMMRPRLVITSREEDMWSRLSRLNSMAFML